MNFHWIKNEETRKICEIHIKALLQGEKVFWLVDELFAKKRDRLAQQVEQCGLLSGEILGEFFIFNPKYFVKIQSLTAKVVNLSDQSIEEFTFDGEIQSLVNNVRTEGGNDRGNITPTLIGRLLFYPVIYKLGSDGKTDWLNHLPLILYEAFLEEVRICSFTFPAIFEEHVSGPIEQWKSYFTPSVKIVKSEIIIPSVIL